jgi:hypothetical protein
MTFDTYFVLKRVGCKSERETMMFLDPKLPVATSKESLFIWYVANTPTYYMAEASTTRAGTSPATPPRG